MQLNTVDLNITDPPVNVYLDPIWFVSSNMAKRKTRTKHSYDCTHLVRSTKTTGRLFDSYVAQNDPELPRLDSLFPTWKSIQHWRDCISLTPQTTPIDRHDPWKSCLGMLTLFLPGLHSHLRTRPVHLQTDPGAAHLGLERFRALDRRLESAAAEPHTSTPGKRC